MGVPLKGRKEVPEGILYRALRRPTDRWMDDVAPTTPTDPGVPWFCFDEPTCRRRGKETSPGGSRAPNGPYWKCIEPL